MFKKLKNLPFSWLIVGSYLLTVMYAWSYGNNYVVYASLSIGLMIFVYIGIFKNSFCRFPSLRKWAVSITFLTTIIGTISGNLQSPLMVNCSLLLPIIISDININYDNLLKQVIYSSALCLPIIVYTSGQAEQWNSNSLAFMMFCGISVGFLWLKFSESKFSKLCAIAFLLYATTYLFLAGSRNAGMVIVLCAVLLFLPDAFYKNKFFYRLLYLVPVFATVFALPLMQFVFSNDAIVGSMTEYTSQYSNKAWGMDTHFEMLVYVHEMFFNSDILHILFGDGIKLHHCHNIFYQCLFFYGIIGTLVVYSIYIWIFEAARKMIRYHKDNLVLGCVIIMLGHFLMQVGEVYMLGLESANIISLVPAGIILQRYNKYYDENTNSNALL